MKKKLLVLFGFLLSHILNAQIPEQLRQDCEMSDTITSPPPPSASGFVAKCTDVTKVRYLPVAFHFILREQPKKFEWWDGCTGAEGVPLSFWSYGNFDEYSDGIGNPYNGYARAEDLIVCMNQQLETNYVQRRKNPAYPISHYDPAPAINIQFILKGVYFHRNTTLYENPWIFRNYHPQYDVGGTSVMDLYMIPCPSCGDPEHGYPPEPNCCGGGEASGFGIADKYSRNSNWRTYVSQGCRNWSCSAAGGLINHEVGHSLDLRHTWNQNDFCADTPLGFIYDQPEGPESNPCLASSSQRANCWSLDVDKVGCPLKPCDTWSKVSNNVMDYTQPYQRALTQEQIDIMNDNLESTAGNSYIHSCDGCMPAQAFLSSKPSYRICASGSLNSVIVSGEGSFNETDYLLEICEVSGPNGSPCVGTTYYSSGWIQHEVEKVDLAQFYSFQANKYYEVVLTVNNSSCPTDDVHQIIFETKDCSPQTPTDLSFSVQSPFSGSTPVNFTTTTGGSITIFATHTSTGFTSVIHTSSNIGIGTFVANDNLGSFPSGSIQITANLNGNYYYTSVVKI
jgi:hypothetical protein